MAIVNKLPQLRRERGVGYKKIARGSGLALSTVKQVCGGAVGRYDAATLDALCRYFDVPVGAILEYVPGEPQPRPEPRPPDSLLAGHPVYGLRR